MSFDWLGPRTSCRLVFGTCRYAGYIYDLWWFHPLVSPAKLRNGLCGWQSVATTTTAFAQIETLKVCLQTVLSIVAPLWVAGTVGMLLAPETADGLLRSRNHSPALDPAYNMPSTLKRLSLSPVCAHARRR